MRWRYEAGAPSGRWAYLQQAFRDKGGWWVARVALCWAASPLVRLGHWLSPRSFQFQSARYI
jgi:hypothetical protein